MKFSFIRSQTFILLKILVLSRAKIGWSKQNKEILSKQVRQFDHNNLLKSVKNHQCKLQLQEPVVI